MEITAKDIAQIVQGHIVGNESVRVFAPAAIENATEGHISFVASAKYEKYLYNTRAGVVLISRDFEPTAPVGCTLIKVQNVYLALSLLFKKFENILRKNVMGISPLASIESSAKLGKNIGLGHYSYIGEMSEIGDATEIYPQVYVGHFVKIGKNCRIYPGVKIYDYCEIGDHCIIHANAVLGSDGFGYIKDEQGINHKIAQLGKVVIENDVEIGAGTTIDRATMGVTHIKSGVKLDNMVQVAHNTTIGKNTVIAAQTGIAGSAEIGNDCMIGGQVGIVGHIKIANGVGVQAKSGIAGNIPEENSKWYGYPAISYNKYLKSYAHFKNLPEMAAKLRQLEKELQELKTNTTENK
jgi:UDP-3-O-[3-hydroxymyristoyl] glucosamine N-acyltransferase